MRLPLFRVAFAVLLLACSSLQAEDLTTLDGRTFTNITDIAKYPSLIVFTYNGDRKGIAFTNLPEAFRVQHGIVIKTNAPVVVGGPSRALGPIDLFLWKNRESLLQQMESENLFTNGDYISNDPHEWFISKTWSLTLKNSGIYLEVDGEIFFHSSATPDVTTVNIMRFEAWNGDSISNLLGKFMDWQNVAATNQAVNFEKEICRRTPDPSVVDPAEKPILEFLHSNPPVVYTFLWREKQATLHVEPNGVYQGDFEADDLSHFQSLLKKLPEMKEKLANDIRKSVSQQNLFK